MKSFKKHTGLIAVLNRSNIDTDQIISKEFLKSIKRTGFGEHLFSDWRYNDDGTPNTKFELNRPEFKGASILITGNNFGCGSSREHAVWAIRQYGFKVVIAPWAERNGTRLPAFADIFRNNAGKNSLLTIEVSEKERDQIIQAVQKKPGLKGTADLENQTITLHTDKEWSFPFDFDASVKNRLINGLDDIAITLKSESAITSFESQHNPQL